MAATFCFALISGSEEGYPSHQQRRASSALVDIWSGMTVAFKHVFVSFQPTSSRTCVHKAKSSEELEVAQEYTLEKLKNWEGKR